MTNTGGDTSKASVGSHITSLSAPVTESDRYLTRKNNNNKKKGQMFVHHHNIANLTVSGLGHKQPCSGTVRGMLCVKCHYAIVRQADITAFIQPDGASADGGFLQQSSRTWRLPGGHESEQRCGDGASAAASAGPPATSITHIGKHMTTAKGDGRPTLGWTEVCSSFFFFFLTIWMWMQRLVHDKIRY